VTTLIGTTTTSCRARIAYPWQGVLRQNVTFAGRAYRAGTLVAVTAAADGGGFQVRVGRVRDAPAETDVTGTVTLAQVDEAVSAVLESSLVGKPNISWVPGSGKWKQLRYVAGQDFTLIEEEEGQPPKHVMVYQGERFNASPAEDRYGITKNGVTGTVAGEMLRLDASIPPCTGSVELLCYELGMYAAALTGLCPDFVRLAMGSRGDLEPGQYWVQASGGTVPEATVRREVLGDLTLRRGDFVLFYDDESAVRSVHMAMATGDAQRIYSLWDAQASFPVVTSIQELFALDMPDQLVCVRAATPGWHLPAA
jgi:hypothetical protein